MQADVRNEGVVWSDTPSSFDTPASHHDSPRQPTTAHDSPRQPTMAPDGLRRPWVLAIHFISCQYIWPIVCAHQIALKVNANPQPAPRPIVSFFLLSGMPSSCFLLLAARILQSHDLKPFRPRLASSPQALLPIVLVLARSRSTADTAPLG
jgi:hypothetical protein